MQPNSQPTMQPNLQPNIQPEHLRVLEQVMAGIPDNDPKDKWEYSSVGGGSINAAFQIKAKGSKRKGGKQLFCKLNDAHKFPGLFANEFKGLQRIAASQAIGTPAILACTEVAGTQVLVLEWIDEGIRTEVFWKRFGEELARLHHISHSSFGLDHDNYMGALPQDNTPAKDWTDFFRERRLQPQVRLAESRGLLPSAASRQFERLYGLLPDLFAPEPPSLLHGDLWSGNFLCDGAGRPVLIDPAIYFGHRSVDLAMTTLFGGFEPGFYEAYAWHYPFPPDHTHQWEIANLYPLLIHLNLFGMGYLSNILHTIQRF